MNVRMAAMEIVTDDRRLRAILGSCVGVVVRDSERRVTGLAHIVLPRRPGEDAVVGKYADTAVPVLVAGLVRQGARPASLTALVVGGAAMFPSAGGSLASIGGRNVEAAHRVLREARIPVVFEDTGGTAGRMLELDNASGAFAVRTLAGLEQRGGAP